MRRRIGIGVLVVSLAAAAMVAFDHDPAGANLVETVNYSVPLPWGGSVGLHATFSGGIPERREVVSWVGIVVGLLLLFWPEHLRLWGAEGEAKK